MRTRGDTGWRRACARTERVDHAKELEAEEEVDEQLDGGRGMRRQDVEARERVDRVCAVVDEERLARAVVARQVAVLQRRDALGVTRAPAGQLEEGEQREDAEHPADDRLQKEPRHVRHPRAGLVPRVRVHCVLERVEDVETRLLLGLHVQHLDVFDAIGGKGARRVFCEERPSGDDTCRLRSMAAAAL